MLKQHIFQLSSVHFSLKRSQNEIKVILMNKSVYQHSVFRTKKKIAKSGTVLHMRVIVFHLPSVGFSV